MPSVSVGVSSPKWSIGDLRCPVVIRGRGARFVGWVSILRCLVCPQMKLRGVTRFESCRVLRGRSRDWRISPNHDQSFVFNYVGLIFPFEWLLHSIQGAGNGLNTHSWKRARKSVTVLEERDSHGSAHGKAWQSWKRELTYPGLLGEYPGLEQRCKIELGIVWCKLSL